jgi:hypothetical protein
MTVADDGQILRTRGFSFGELWWPLGSVHTGGMSGITNCMLIKPKVIKQLKTNQTNLTIYTLT